MATDSDPESHAAAVRWNGRAGQGDISPTAAQLAALEDFRAVHASPSVFTPVALTKEGAETIGRARGLTTDELLQVMDEWLGFNRTRDSGGQITTEPAAG